MRTIAEKIVTVTHVVSVMCDNCKQPVPCNVPANGHLAHGLDLNLGDQVWLSGVRAAVLAGHDCEVNDE
jgi:hypothetical protein